MPNGSLQWDRSRAILFLDLHDGCIGEFTLWKFRKLLTYDLCIFLCIHYTLIKSLLKNIPLCGIFAIKHRHLSVAPAPSLAAIPALEPHSLCSKLTSLHLVPGMAKFSWPETFLLPHGSGISKNSFSVEMAPSQRGLTSPFHLSCPIPSMILSQCPVCSSFH